MPCWISGALAASDPRHAHACTQVWHFEHAGTRKRGSNVRPHLVLLGASVCALRRARRSGRVDNAHHARLPDLVASLGVELAAGGVELRAEVDALVAEHICKVALQVLKRAELLEALRARNARRVVAVDGQLKAIVVKTVAIQRSSVVVEARDRVAVGILQIATVATRTGDARLFRGATTEDKRKLGCAQVVGFGDHFLARCGGRFCAIGHGREPEAHHAALAAEGAKPAEQGFC